MTHRERIAATLAHSSTDRPPVDCLTLPGAFREALIRATGASDYESALRMLGADLRHVDHRSFRPGPDRDPDGAFRDMWGVVRRPVANQYGTYDEVFDRPLARIETLADVERYPWPSPDIYCFSRLADQCREHRERGYVVAFGGPGVMDLINGTAFGRGMEQVLVDVALGDAVGMAILERRQEFFLSVVERALSEAGSLMDVLWIGDDYGTQTGPLFRPEVWKQVFAPKLRAFIELGHRHGLRVMLHSCGSNREVLPFWIDMGLDIYQAVQVEASGMEPEGLFRDFGRDIVFHGMIGMQSTLPHGTPDEVRQAVRERTQASGGTGWIAAPSHFFDLDVPVENALALFEEALQCG